MSETNDNSGSAREGRESLGSILKSWGEILSELVDEAEKFTREKPSAGLATAFLAGLVLGSIFRRR
jgi:ElaB/YqjD/DUF883 family membrane-anchored ribosome-binding protein